MEITKRKNKIIVTHLLKRGEIYKFRESKTSQSFFIYKKPVIVSGYSNSCEDGRAILFLDYDSVDLSVVEEDYLYIQSKYKLPPGYLFKSSESSFHLVCLKKFSHKEIQRIIQDTRVDERFKTMYLRTKYRNYVLRLSGKGKKEKPSLEGIIGKITNLSYEISSAHLNLIKKIFGISKENFIPYTKEDSLSKVELQEYETWG